MVKNKAAVKALKTPSRSASINARTTIRRIGNSKGIILSNKVLSELHLEEGSEVEILLSGRTIRVVPVNRKREINKNLTSWGAQFKAAQKMGQMPEADLFEGMANEFDNTDWQ